MKPNTTTGMPQVSNTIFNAVDEVCKKYLTPNSLALQRKQIVESLLYRTWIKEISNMVIQVMFFVYDYVIYLSKNA